MPLPPTTKRATRFGTGRGILPGCRRRTWQGWLLGGGPELPTTADDLIGPVKPDVRTYKGIKERLGREMAAEYEGFLRAVETQRPFYGWYFGYMPARSPVPPALARMCDEIAYGDGGRAADPSMRSLIPMVDPAPQEA